ncbi:MAG: hypothetical protein L6R40_002817 [Gallowayella cf. fulva]|nr:MAG: hypothetical protein L6R40_002817 [Xanthomendoza cf. fulva]
MKRNGISILSLTDALCPFLADTTPCLSYKLPKSDGSDYKPPYCPGARCGTCYTITNPKNGKKITVQIIDACPANTAFNYCKTIATNDADIVGPRDSLLKRDKTSPSSHGVPMACHKLPCGSADVNSLDIDTSAYAMLSDDGEGYQSGVTPNLNIKITSNPSCSV